MHSICLLLAVCSLAAVTAAPHESHKSDDEAPILIRDNVAKDEPKPELVKLDHTDNLQENKDPSPVREKRSHHKGGCGGNCGGYPQYGGGGGGATATANANANANSYGGGGGRYPSGGGCLRCGGGYYK